jgi:hypothetical protein
MNVTALFFTLVLLLTPARSGVPVELVLYRGQGAVWEERVAGRCLTDASGRCAIQGRAEAWADGFLRGEVRWEGHARPLIWPGGDLQIELSETLAGDARYDTLPERADAPLIVRERVNWLLLALGAAALAFSLAVYRRERSERRRAG